jgi:hypothetical protein
LPENNIEIADSESQRKLGGDRLQPAVSNVVKLTKR